MASPIGVSALVAQDVIKFVLPTFLGLSLVAPFWNSRISPDVLLFASLFLGFSLTPRIGNLYLKLVTSKSASEGLKRIFRLYNGRWNYDRLFHAGGKDTQNAITLTDARATLTLMISCYFLVFAIVVFVWCIVTTLPAENGFLAWLGLTLVKPVPLILGQQAPAAACFVIALIVARISFTDYMEQKTMQFSSQYPEAAKSLHLEAGDVAKAIWGQVTDPTPPASDSNESRSAAEGLKVLLSIADTTEIITTADIDELGHFTFAANPYQYLAVTLVATVDGTPWTSRLTIADRKTVPEFPIIAGTKISADPPPDPEKTPVTDVADTDVK